MTAWPKSLACKSKSPICSSRSMRSKSLSISCAANTMRLPVWLATLLLWRSKHIWHGKTSWPLSVLRPARGWPACWKSVHSRRLPSRCPWISLVREK
nr:MAG TPA: hypothetical protein [Caudoviricetes sp.]